MGIHTYLCAQVALTCSQVIPQALACTPSSCSLPGARGLPCSSNLTGLPPWGITTGPSLSDCQHRGREQAEGGMAVAEKAASLASWVRVEAEEVAAVVVAVVVLLVVDVELCCVCEG